MQDAIRYLEAVLPASGLRIVASKPPGWTKGFKHTFCATNRDVVAETMRLDAAGVTNYIALATYNDPEAGRTATNTVELQCLWLDTDYKHFETAEEAAEQVSRLFPVIGEPSITVESGGGRHDYWVLRAPMKTADWKPLAEAFQALWQSLGVQADPISADAARVLRLPGTHNRKPEYPAPREVRIVSYQDLTYDAGALAKKLNAAKPAPTLPTRVNVPAELQLNDELSGGLERRPPHVREMATRCNHLKWAFANQEKTAEPQWFAVIQVVRHSVEGRQAAHIFSNRHPAYTFEETEAKLDQLDAKGIGPTTCAKMRQVNPMACDGCQFSITSPIQLGYRDVEAVAPKVQVVERAVDETGESILVEREAPAPTMPEGYKYDGHNIYRRVQDESTGMWREEQVYAGFLCPERLVTNERANYATDIQLYAQPTGQPPKRVTIPGKALSDKRDLGRELTGKGIFFMTKNVAHLLDMLQKMVGAVQASRRDAVVADQMGWHDDKTFVVGSTGYTQDGAPQFDLPVPTGTKSSVRFYEPKGTLAKWMEAADVYNKPGAEAYQFALLYGAAGVLLPMTRLSGVVLSLYSQKAGRGKTTAGYAALSWWGDPDGLKSQSKDTNNALFSKASRHKNLPILMDEVTDKPAFELEDLVYFLTQGREKESLNSDRTARAIMPGWALPAISTSNNSLRSKLMGRRGDAQGLFARILEVNCDLQYAVSMGFTERMLLRYGFVENFGWAGPMIVKYVMGNRASVQDTMDKLTKVLDSAVEGDSAYRFWVASCAATLTAASCAVRMGLLKYDLQRLIKWTMDMIRAQRTDAMTSLATSEDVLAQFLEQNANRVVVSYIKQLSPNVSMPAVWPEDGVRGVELVGRVEVPKGSLFISLPAFTRYCNEAGFDVASFILQASTRVDQASGQFLLKQKTYVRCNLGRGTKNASATTKALEFNLNHPSLQEYAAGIGGVTTEASPVRSVK